MDKAKKDLVIPKSLGNFVTEGGSGGGITPEEAAEIASAVTEAAIDEYDTELQVELEEIRDAISGNTDTLLDLATIAAMSIADRVALFDEIFEKASNGEKVYIKGLVQEETIRTAILPLVSYRPETNPVLHQGGNLYFAAKGDTDNVYFHIGLTSEGAIDPTSGNIIKRNIYNLPTASAEVKGGVRIGSGLTMTQDTLSVDTTGLVTDGDLAPFIVQQSANTQNITSLSAATEAISESLGNYATTADTNELATAISGVSDSLSNYATTATTDALSAVTSALTENLEALSAVTSGLVSAQDIVYDYAVISRYTAAQKQALWNEISGYKNTNKKVWIRHQLSSEVRWYLCYKFDAPYIYFVANDNRKIYMLMFNQTGSFSNSEYVIQYQLSAGSGISISNNVASVKIGEGLAFSGDTLVASGGSSNTKVIFLNKLTEQERLALYNELASKYDYSTNSWTSAFTEDEYTFFIDLRESADQQAYSVNDEFEGFFPMQIVRMHPTDYGGGAFFSGVAGSRYGQAIVINIRFVITYDGQVDRGTWWNNPVATPEYVFNLNITSAGTIAWGANWEPVGDSEKWSRLAMRYYYDTGWEGWQAHSTAPVKWVYDYLTEVDSEVKQYYILTADISINGTIYTGVWGVLQDHWYGNEDPLCPKLISWTSGSTITDPSYPPYVPNV